MATRADDNGPFKEFVLDEWLRDQARERCRELENCLYPRSGFGRHLRKTYREQLLAVRKVINKAIDYIDQQEARARRT